MSIKDSKAKRKSPTTLDWALKYIGMGWKVLPLWAAKADGTCQCGKADCTVKDIGKHPVSALAPNGCYSASGDEATVRGWFTDTDYNIAVATGSGSGVTVVDVDINEGKKGLASWQALNEGHGEPDTLMAETGSGGMHVFFRYNADPAIKSKNDLLGLNIDVKNDSGYVVVCPSRHRSGGSYSWQNWGTNVAGWPSWFVPVRKKNDDSPRKDKATRSYSLAEVTGMLEAIPSEDRDLWRNMGVMLGRIFERSDEAWDLYVAWCEKGCDKKGRNHDKQMRSFFFEMSQEVTNNPLTIGTIIQLAKKGGWKPDVGLILAQLRAMPLDDLKGAWPLYLEGLKVVERKTVLDEVVRLTGIPINTLKQALAERRADAHTEKVASRVGDRTVIPYYPEDVCRVAEQVETAMLARSAEGECVRFGDSVMRVVVDVLPHAHQADSDRPSVPIPNFDLLTRIKLLPLVERAVVMTRKGSPADIPDKVLEQILANPHLVPPVSGLVAHPLVTQKGRIIAATGIDAATRLLLHGAALDGLRPYGQDEAHTAMGEIERLFLDGFEFATPLDRTAAIACLFTAVERKLLRECPGFLITAAQQSLGKTTLARLTHCLLTGTDAPVFTWPEKDDVEVQKLLLSTLLRNPALIIFDNVGDGLTFRSPALSSAMTSDTKQGRLLGHNRDAVVSTNVLFILTGNNVELGNDETSRMIPTRLITSTATPHKRTFAHPDVMRHGLEIRDTVLRHVIGIVAGYRVQAERLAPLSRFPQWDALVRQPLIWAGLDDVGVIFDQNIEASQELGAHKALLIALELWSKGEQFNIKALVDTTNNFCQTSLHAATFDETLSALHVKDLTKVNSVGYALNKILGRTVSVLEADGTVSTLSLKRDSLHGLARYRVIRAKEVGS